MKTYLSTLLALLLAPLCWAQTNNQGSITGTVSDPAGAVIPGVRLAVTNVDTHITRTLVSDREGSYRLDFLQPGAYQIQAEMQGFAATTLTGLKLTVGQLLRADLKMAVGSTTESVTVNATGGSLNTETAALGDVISSQSIDNLPINGREFIGLAALVSGASSGSPKRGAITSRGYSIAFNGARASYNNYYVDGAESTDPYDSSLTSSPPLDSIREFRVETSMYSAQYGRSGGAIISAITKSGTNKFHGNLYEYHRDKALDARPYFFTEPRSKQPNYIFNQYGGTVGGPIWKNKTFFFFSLERFKSVAPGGLLLSQAPTALERVGDFSQSLNQYTLQPVVLKDPYTGQDIPGNVLPASLITAVGKTLMDLQPQPNYSDPANPLQNLRVFGSSSSTQKKYLGRVDHTFNQSNQLSGTFDYNNYDSSSTSFDKYGATNSLNHNKGYTATYTHTFRPNLITDLHFTYSRYATGSLPLLVDKNYAAEWGIDTTLQNSNGAPGIYIYGRYGYYSGGAGIYTHNDKTTIVRDNLEWVKGRHTVLFGGDYRHQYFGWINGAGTASYAFGFLDGYLDSAGNPAYQNYYGYTGTPYGDLLAGITDWIVAGLGRGKDMPLARNTPSLYVQDDWKVSPRLTLNLGVRWDYDAPFSMLNGEYMTIDYDTWLPRYAKGAPADLLALVKYPYETNGPNRPFYPSWKNFAPRIGFAFRPFKDEKTVVRGGYGMFFVSTPADLTTLGSYAFPFQTNTGYIYTKGPEFQTASSVYTIDQPTPGLSSLYGQNPGYFTFISPYFPTSYIENYNLSVGRDLGHQVVAEVSYVGSRGVNLSGEIATSTYSQEMVAFLKANLNGWGYQAMHEEGYNSFYNSLQATVRKNMSNGIFFISSYTWSHAIADSSNDQDNENITTDLNAYGGIAFTKRRSNADFNVPQRFTFSGGWQLPVGRGKRFGTSWNRYLNGVLGGWQANAILTFQSGFPYSVRTAGYLVPDRICNGNLPRSQRTLQRWFDTDCFVDAPFVTVTDPVTGVQSQVQRAGNAGANIITGPGTNNWDIGIEKNFRFTEGTGLQLRGEFFNAFNHPQYIGPDQSFNVQNPAITQVRSQRDIQVALKLYF
jgi:hypothetical protein